MYLCRKWKDCFHSLALIIKAEEIGVINYLLLISPPQMTLLFRVLFLNKMLYNGEENIKE